MPFVTYDKKTQALKSSAITNIPKTCTRYFNDENKLCKKFYVNNIKDDGFYVCPYGFTCLKIKNKIYTGIVENSVVDNNKKLRANLNKYDEGYKSFILYEREGIKQIIDTYEEYQYKYSILEDAIHDIRNVMREINIIKDKYNDANKRNNDQKKQSDSYKLDEIDSKSLIGLNELLGYRLKIINEIEKDNEFSVKNLQCIQPTLHKFKYMMDYQNKKKDVYIDLANNSQYNEFYLSEEVYLGLFILYENAIKHSNPSSKIEIRFEEPDLKNTTVIIKNISKRIESDEKDLIFDRGYRGRNTNSSGTGIGLGKAKEIFKKHGIGFDIDLKDIDSNTQFIVTLKFSK